MKVYLAGGESMHGPLKRCGVKSVLISYYYLRTKGPKVIEKVLREFADVFLDSGAYTLQQQLLKSVGSAAQNTLYVQEMDSYLKEYINFIREYGTAFQVVAELDVGTWQQKTRYREILEDTIPKNVVLTPVVHRSDPDEYVAYLCSKYPLIAMGGLRTGRSTAEMRKYLAKRMLIPRKYGTRVHGFAITIGDIMRSVGMASVDSASWLHGGKHGMTYWFDGRHLRSYDKHQKWVRLRFKGEVTSLGLKWDDFMDDKPKTIDAFNIFQWVKFQNYLLTEGAGLGKFKASQERYFLERGAGNEGKSRSLHITRGRECIRNRSGVLPSVQSETVHS